MNKKAPKHSSLLWKLRNIISVQPGDVKRRDLSNGRESEVQLELDLQPGKNDMLDGLFDTQQPR